MRRALLAVALAIPLVGCSHISAKQKAMAGASITATFVDGAHHIYSGEFNARLDKCNPGTNPDSAVKTKSDMQECLGTGFDSKSRDTIDIALKSYETAARAFEVAIAGDDDDARAQAISDLVKAATGLVEALPDNKLSTKLKALTAPWN